MTRASPSGRARDGSAREPLVSVGLPTYNRAASLRTAVESVLAQDYQNLELVISDNASTDGTRDLCEAFARSDPRVRYHRQPENRGPTANFREALERATGEFFLWLADDDRIDPGYVSACVRELLRDPEAVLVAGRAAYYEGSRLLFVEPPLTLESDDPRARVQGYFRHVGANGIFYGVARRAVLRAVPFRHTLAADWLLIAALAFHGKLRTLDEVTLHRSADGASRDVERLAAGFGLPRFFQRQARLYMARNAFRDVAWRSPAYRPLGIAGRWALAARVCAVLMLRFYVARPMRKLQAYLRAWAPGGSRVLEPGESKP